MTKEKYNLSYRNNVKLKSNTRRWLFTKYLYALFVAKLFFKSFDTEFSIKDIKIYNKN